jgi:hypothetical protein
LQPVADKGGGKNSLFAKAFIQALTANPEIMDSTELFQSLRRPVMVADAWMIPLQLLCACRSVS